MANRQIREIKHDYWERFTKDMENDLYGSQRKVWKMLRNRKAVINDTFNIYNITSQWMKYFKKIYEADQSDQSKVFNDPREEIPPCQNQTTMIEEIEVQRIILSLKNRKAPGIDEISNELIKYGGKHLVEELTKLINLILQTSKIPRERKISLTIPVFKRDKNSPANYRGITLLSAILKTLTKIILSRLD